MVNIKLSKTQLSKITESCRFLRRIIGLLMKVGLSLMNDGLTQLANNMSIMLELKAEAAIMPQ